MLMRVYKHLKSQELLVCISVPKINGHDATQASELSPIESRAFKGNLSQTVSSFALDTDVLCRIVAVDYRCVMYTSNP
mgnify:CR=1 FL=1